MKRFESVIVVGSSGSGKTTLVNGLRTAEYNSQVKIPQRFITRPRRLGDDTVENLPISRGGFMQGIQIGTIRPHWQRELDGGRVEWYGFAAIDKADSRLTVYSANNALLRDPNKGVAAALETGLVVAVSSSIAARERRLLQRSPDMSPAERAIRLADDGPDLTGIKNVEVIDTSNLEPGSGQEALQSIVQKIVANACK